LLLGAIFAISTCSCSSQNPNNTDIQSPNSQMYIKPSVFSEETQQILELLDEEITFFDIVLNDNVKSYAISLWIFNDGKWSEQGKILGDNSADAHRIAAKITGDTCVLYSIDENGHSKCTYRDLNISFEESLGIISSKIHSETFIELDTEIPVWVKIGNDENHLESLDLDNFKNAKCNAGFAITFTAYSEAAT